MEKNEIIKLIKEQWPLILVLVIVLTPSIWTIAHVHYSAEINALVRQIEAVEKEKNFLDKQIEELKAKKDEFKLLFIQKRKHAINPSELYTPSPDTDEKRRTTK